MEQLMHHRTPTYTNHLGPKTHHPTPTPAACGQDEDHNDEQRTVMGLGLDLAIRRMSGHL